MKARHARHLTGKDDSGMIIRSTKRPSPTRLYRYIPGAVGGQSYDTRMIPMLCDVDATGWDFRTDPALPVDAETWARDNYEWTYDGDPLHQPDRVTYTTEIDVTNDRNALSFVMGYNNISLDWTWRTLKPGHPLDPRRITTIGLKTNVQKNTSHPPGERLIPCQFRVLIDTVEVRGWTEAMAGELMEVPGSVPGVVLEDFGEYTSRVRVDVEVDFDLSSFSNGFTMNISRGHITGAPEFRPSYVLANPGWERCVEVVGGILPSDSPSSSNPTAAIIHPVSGALLTQHPTGRGDTVVVNGKTYLYLGWHPTGDDASPDDWPWITWTTTASLGDQDEFGLWQDSGSQTFRRIRQRNYTSQSGSARIPAYAPASGTKTIRPCGTGDEITSSEIQSYSVSAGTQDNSDDYNEVGTPVQGPLVDSVHYFANVQITNGTTISQALLRLYPGTPTAGAGVNFNAYIKAQDVDDASAPSTLSDYLALSWIATVVNVIESAETPPDPIEIDITTVIQAMINRAGWNSGNAINLAVNSNDAVSGQYVMPWNSASELIIT